MAERLTDLKKIAAYLADNLCYVITAGLYLVWMFCLTLHHAYFAANLDILYALGFFGVCITLVMVEATALFFLNGAWHTIGRHHSAPRTLALVCAAASAGLACAKITFGITSLMLESALCLSTATSLTAAFATQFAFLARTSFTKKLSLFAGELLCAVVCFLVLTALVADSSTFLAVLAIALTLAVPLSNKTNTPLIGTKRNDNLANQRNSGQHASWRGQFRLAITLFWLLFASGFLFAYELGVMQKTTHFAGIMTTSATMHGVSLASMLYLALFVVLTMVLLAEVAKPSLPLAGITVVLLLVCTYYCLPIMASSSFPVSFVLIQAIASTLLVWSVFLFFETLSCKGNSAFTLKSLFGGLFIVSFGCLCGIGTSYALMSSFDTITYRNELFSILPAALIFLIIATLLFSYKYLVGQFRHEPFSKPLDTSRMENRCELFANACNLTKREREVLLLLSTGRNIPAVAEALVVSSATAKTHMLHIYKKAGISSRQELLNLLYDDDRFGKQPTS